MTLTGRRWRRPPRRCPEWCAQDHQCTAGYGYPSGEHRSDPLQLFEHHPLEGRRGRPRYGTLVATRIEDRHGRGRLEVRANVRLAGDAELARHQAQQLAVRIDAAIRDALGLPTTPAGPARPAVQQHPGARQLVTGEVAP